MSKNGNSALMKTRATLKRAMANRTRVLLNELKLEGLAEEDIAHEIGTSRQSVNNWSLGKGPTQRHAAAVAKMHRQVMYLKAQGVIYADIMRDKTLEQAYSEKKGQEQAA